MPDTTTPSGTPPGTPPGSALPPPGPSGPTMEWIEPPPPTMPSQNPPRPGQLTTAWRAMVVTTWVGAFVGYLAVWKASEEIGLATWWLGPRSSPQPIVVRLLPFIVTATFGILASYNVPRMPVIGVVGALGLAAIAVPDLSRSTGLALIEFAIAGAVLLVSVASFTGTYRKPQSQHAG